MTRILIFSLLIVYTITGAQSNPPRVLFQAFWWDYQNNNYPYGWYNYLAELAPRLRGYGIDAVWIPPSSKGGDHNDNGYGIFDHYDLGDKYQKGDVRTRLGTKDEYLRMVAIMHANGIDVIQDVVLNHVNGAGPLDAGSDQTLGKGGKDPNAPDNKWKNFRYTSFLTPASSETVDDYLNRMGRWPKNYQNFHKSGGAFGHNDYDYPQHGEMFGPDICYQPDAINTYGIPLSPATYGLTSIYNPTQPSGYMKQQAIEWGVWLKKQTGVDGVRLDATKHFKWDVTEAFLWNLQHGAGLYGSGSTWSNGTDNMFAVSEYVPEGGQATMEDFIDGAQNRTGTFDFNLRDGIYSMISAGGFFDISQIPGYQINDTHRLRTVSFINNHDTFRPRKDASGNYSGWYDGIHEPQEPDDYPDNPNDPNDPNNFKWEDNNELRPHIDPFNDRLPTAYAIIASVDGSPQVFFEDLFNIGGKGNRFTHDPKDVSDLTSRPKIENIIWARRALNFTGGAYKVRSAEGATVFDMGSGLSDLLIIERSTKAVIGVNDNGNSWQGAWVDTDFSPGTWVKDYSGANGAWEYQVDDSKRVHINVPPANAQFGGYCIIAPKGFDGITFNPTQRETIQEWDMSPDLGDSNPKSLLQGGGLFNKTYNYVGQIYSDISKKITIELFPDMNQFPDGDEFAIYVENENNVYSISGKASSTPLELSFTAGSKGWYKIFAKRNSNVIPFNPNPNQPLPDWPISHVWVKATYTAPKTVDLSLDNANVFNQFEINNELKDLIISVFPNPSVNEDIRIQYSLVNPMNVNFGIYDSSGTLLYRVREGYVEKGDYEYLLRNSELSGGTYYYRVETDEGSTSGRFVVDR